MVNGCAGAAPMVPEPKTEYTEFYEIDKINIIQFLFEHRQYNVL